MRFARDGVRQGSGHGTACRQIGLLVLLATAALLSLAGPALATTQLQPCGKNLTCGHVLVPLDRSGQVPGQVSLYVERYAQNPNPTGGTVIALAGGPGQSAVDLIDGFEEDLAPILANRALVVFDPRGVGRSGDLTCPEPGQSTSSVDWVSQCAATLGPRRAFYSTANSVADIDAVRTELGLQQVTLHGVSYGTYTALAYARAHPAQVDHLILDSSLPADGGPLFNLNSLPAMRRMLGPAALRDLTTLLRRPPTPFELAGRHARITSTISGEAVYEALFASDLHPFVRASLPAALHLAAAGDLNALARLSEVSFGLSLDDPRPPHTTLLPQVSIARASNMDVDYLATGCEDEAFPWSVADALGSRQLKLQAVEGALAPASFAPFNLETITTESGEGDCAGWPEASDAPNRITGPLPAVPTLILSGRDDIRTPLEDATALASQLPNATLLSVPAAGHAVLYADQSGCAKRGLAAFISNRSVTQCGAGRREPVDPLPPVLAKLAAAPGLPGAPGRVLRAAVLTLRHDVGFTEFAAEQVGVTAGTRAGYLRASGHGHDVIFKLKGISYVNGLALSGRLTVRPHKRAAFGRLAVTLRGHSYGVLTLTADGKISGRLGSVDFRLSRSARERINRQGGLTRLALG
jgi:pimeloyl-ACP methyl ester carboxylesterase